MYICIYIYIYIYTYIYIYIYTYLDGQQGPLWLRALAEDAVDALHEQRELRPVDLRAELAPLAYYYYYHYYHYYYHYHYYY